MWNTRFAAITTLSVMLALTGCGGGGGSSSDDDEPATAEGRFLDSPVEGLQYTSGDITGVTDANGTFIYSVGGTVLFTVGDVVLGSANGSTVITPLDLVPDAADENDDTVVNLLRFLQSLDADGDPDNGITISATVQDYFNNQTINFEQTVDAFEADETLLSILNQIPLDEIGNDRELVSAFNALAHFQITLASLDVADDIDDLIEISEADIINYQEAGVWRSASAFSFTLNDSYSFGGQTYTMTADVGIESVAVSISEEVNATSSLVTSCYVNGPETIDVSDWLDVDTGEEDMDICDDETQKYYRNADGSELAMVLYCGADAYGRIDFKHLSDVPAFDFGTLSFTSGLYNDLDSSDGVCGQLEDLETQTTVTPALDAVESGDSKSYEIGVMAPYGGQYIMFYFEFLNKPTAGNYTVVNNYVTDDLVGNQVLVRLHTSAAEMGGNLDDPEVIRAVSGTITLSALGTYSASGSFDLVMDNSDDIEGDFNFALQ
ncbi:hypothetical protein Q4583_10190 [Neptunomonas phycophila]|uniref:hypothetical protein n=1 Tax=Neptunomonas phycophila TaxID=1572645 RepID=UPI0026E29A01|nr:hypothetical protein [Neptunomonas phycophila]MDO6784484.1 hypothetical protein [Neptunomonas phycophila]